MIYSRSLDLLMCQADGLTPSVQELRLGRAGQNVFVGHVEQWLATWAYYPRNMNVKGLWLS